MAAGMFAGDWIARIGSVLSRLPKRSVCAEIGVYKGEFSRLVLERIEPVRFHLIDPWEYVSDPAYEKSWYGGRVGKDQVNMDIIYRSVCETLGSKGNVVIHRNRSADCAHLFADAYFDWVYVDGNHQYEFAKQDLELYFTKVKPGGFIACDISATNCSEQRPDRHTCHPCPPGRAKQRYARDSLNGVAGWKEFEAESTCPARSPEIGACVRG